MGPYDDDGPYPSHYYLPNKRGKQPLSLLLSEGPEGHGSRMLLRMHQILLQQSAWLLEKDLQFLAKQPLGTLLLLDENGDSVITHPADRGNMLSLKFLSSLQSCVDTEFPWPWQVAHSTQARVQSQ